MEPNSLDEMFPNEYKPRAIDIGTGDLGAVTQGNC